jgi:hypothetical protein
MKLPEEQITHINRPEIPETFVDSLGLITLDGPITRLELCVTRMDEPKPPAVPTAKRYSVCRLVLAPEAVIALANQLNNIMSHLQKAGLVTRKEGNQLEAKKDIQEEKPPEAKKKH